MKARKGFTLVELLIVMAIIAALLAILVPIAGGAMKRAKVTKIAARMRNVEQGAEQYLLSEMPDNP
ncbi:MAG: type II secretion system protein, partial [Thermotogae bacterium]